MAEKLATTGHKWTPQARWGFRLFDFWSHELGIAVEVDGPEHDREHDQQRDRDDWRVSGIIVLRVRNGDERDADTALQAIRESDTWEARRRSLGLYRGKRA